MSVNWGLYFRVVDHIAGFEDPAQFDMGPVAYALEGYKVGDLCGTVACFAGWTLVLCGFDANSDEWYEKAIELLAIDGGQAQSLFFTAGWPEQWRDKLYGDRGRTNYREYRDAAVAYFRHWAASEQARLEAV